MQEWCSRRPGSPSPRRCARGTGTSAYLERVWASLYAVSPFLFTHHRSSSSFDGKTRKSNLVAKFSGTSWESKKSAKRAFKPRSTAIAPLPWRRSWSTPHHKMEYVPSSSFLMLDELKSNGWLTFLFSRSGLSSTARCMTPHLGLEITLEAQMCSFDLQERCELIITMENGRLTKCCFQHDQLHRMCPKCSSWRITQALPYRKLATIK